MYLSLIYLNLFFTLIPHSYLPKSWKWVKDFLFSSSLNLKTAKKSSKGSVKGGQGHFIDKNSNKVDSIVRFRIKDFKTQVKIKSNRGFVSIKGMLLSAEKERKIKAKKREKRIS